MDYHANKSDNGNAFDKFVDWIEKGINPAVDPCVDFFGYACGGINFENYETSLGEYPSVRYYDGFERIFENESINCPLIRKARDFYNSLPTDPVTILQDDGVIEFCGGFPAFHNNWTSENFNWIKAAAILSTVELDTLLTCSVGYLENRKIIEVRTRTPTIEEFENIEETLRKLQISEENIWDIINDVNILMEQFDRIVNIADDPQDLRIRKLFSELREDPFDYQAYFESFLGHPLNDDDIFHLNYDQPGYLDRFLNVFTEASPRTVANYITFRALQYGEEYRGNWRWPLTLRHFAPILLAVSFKNYWNQAKQDNRNDVRKVLKDSLEDYEKPTHNPEVIDLILNRDERVLEFINSNFQYQKIEAEYEVVEINSDNFFTNIINVGRNGPPVSIRKCYSYRYEEQNIYYDAKAFLEFFIHHHDKPLIYYFSGWNADNWERICDCMIGDMECKLRFEAFESIERCIRQQIKSIDPSEDQDQEEEYEDEINYRMHIYICAIIKLRKSYENYSTWLSENEYDLRKQDEMLKRLNLNSRKAFFVSFIQQYCYKESECRKAEILAILNCEEFAKEFQCESNSLMNPKNKCELKWSIS